MKGLGRGSGRGQGRGQGTGAGGGGRGAGGGRMAGGGMGAGGSCVCPKCGKSFPHSPGAPCLKERCPECGVALVREGSAHHQEIEARRDRAADADD